MKSRDGKSQREEKSRREKSRREKIREEKESEERRCRCARKGRKVAKHCVFPMIWGSGGSKSRLAKAAGAEPSGQMRDEKLHGVVARSTFPSQNLQNTLSDHFWKLRWRKSARRCGAKHMSKSKCTKHTRFGPLLEIEMAKKYTLLWREAHVEVKMYKTRQVRTTFGSWDVEKVHAVVARSTFRSQNVKSTTCSDHFLKFRCRFAWQAQGIVHLVKSVQKTWGFCSSCQNDGRRGTFEEDLQRCISRGRRNTRDMFIRGAKRSGRWFPESGCILGHQIFSFGKMILRDKCSTSYDLQSLFRGKRNTLEAWSWKIAKRIGTKPSALHSTFHVWRKFCRIASFLMLSSSKIEEVSQNCFVLDVAKFKNWGSLAELLRFGCCLEEVSQNCLVFKLAGRQTDRQANR